MNNSDVSSSLFSCFTLIFFIAVIGGLIYLLIYLIRKSQDQARVSEAAITQIMLSIPQDKQMMFMMQYNNIKKNPTTAILLGLLLGGIGGHKFYLGQTGAGIVYLLFFWTYIPGLIAFFELFNLSAQVGRYNHQKAIELALIFGSSKQNLYS